MLELGILASGGLGYETLSKIYKDYSIAFVLTDSNSESTISFCKTNKISCFKGSPRNGLGKEFIKSKPVDILISINYLFLIEDDIISHPSSFCFNIHGSLLPKYRGRTPHVWAIINGETEVGITAHKIDSGCDTGDIIEQIKIPVSENMTGGEVLKKYAQAYYPLIKKILANYKSSTLNFTKQDDSKSTYFGKRTPDDGEIDWSWTLVRIHNWVRAQAFPYPGAFTFIGQDKITIDKVKQVKGLVLQHKSPNIGEILSIKPLIIYSSEGPIEIEYREEIKFQLGQVCKEKKQ